MADEWELVASNKMHVAVRHRRTGKEYGFYVIPRQDGIAAHLSLADQPHTANPNEGSLSVDAARYATTRAKRLMLI